MTSGEWLHHSTTQLEASGIATARLDCLVLLEDILHTNRAHLLAHLEQALTLEQLNTLNILTQRRSAHEPLAYIRNKTEFYGREFYVDHRVLEPRPESETMIELLKNLPRAKQSTIIDIGTGSGALAITAKLELRGAPVAGVDIDPGCLDVARRNAKMLDADVAWLEGDLLQPLTSTHDLESGNSILLCNLPYVPDNFQINPAAMNEPRLAIFGGSDGLELYRKLFAQLASRHAKPAYVLTESLPPQHVELKHVADGAGFVLDQVDDFIQVFRTNSGSSAL